MAEVLITGNTFPVKDQLKALGGKWDANAKGWRVPSEKAADARDIVAAVGQPSRTYSPAPKSQAAPRRDWQPCGYPGCSPSYCDECDGKGRRARW